jgi:hypothetical protein
MFKREAHHPVIRVRFTVERIIRGRTFFIFWRELLRRRWLRLPLELTLLIDPA